MERDRRSAVRSGSRFLAAARRPDFDVAFGYGYAQSMQLTSLAKDAYRKRQYIRWLIHDERTNRRPIPRAERLRAWKAGFLSLTYRMCQIDRNGPKDYVTDRMRYLRTPFLNGSYSVVLDDKLIFNEVFRRHPGLLPETYGLFRRDRVLPLSSDRVVSYDDVLRLLDAKGRLVVKPTTGGGGGNVVVLERRADGVAWNGEVGAPERLRERLKSSRDRLLTEFVQQARYAQEIHPGSANTIRVLCLWNDDEKEPFVARAVHRFGSPATIPVDNITQGGLDALVDLESGRLGRGARMTPDGRPEWHDSHPDTGARIEGVQVPRWRETLDALLAVHSKYPELPYVGWDVVVTEDGFKLLEGNNMSGLWMFQVHGPLLANPRVRRFFERRKVLR